MVAKKPDDERKVPISFRVLPATRDRLKLAAKQQGCSLSDLNKKWIAEKLADHERRHARPARPVPKAGQKD